VSPIRTVIAVLPAACSSDAGEDGSESGGLDDAVALVSGGRCL
jgi:hypothetical protein